MKLAAVHCWTTQWWALNVFKDLIEEELQILTFSDILIFTSYSEFDTISINNNQIKIITALPKRLNIFFKRNSKKKLPILWRLFDYRNLMFFYPLLMKVISRKIDKYNPNKILISSFAIAKNIEQCKKRNNWPNVTLYLHSPMQYIWSHAKEYQQKLTGRKWLILNQITPSLKKRDLQYTKYNKVYTNSVYTKNIAKEIYNIEGEVKYPKLNQIFLNEKITIKPKEYVVCTWRIVKFVREVDLIIKAFNKLWYPLIIIWSWPDEKELRKLAKKNITFAGRKNEQEIVNLVKNARWSINLTKESFGLSTAESLCLWVPVLGYSQWATPELLDKDSWIIIDNKTDLEKTFHIFIGRKRNREQISLRARKLFSIK